jgi:hypothetical protein
MLNKLKDIDGKLIRHISHRSTEEELNEDDAEREEHKQVAFNREDNEPASEPYHRPNLSIYPTHHILKNSSLTVPG